MPTMLADLRNLLKLLSPQAILSATVYPYQKAWAETVWTDTGKRRSLPGIIAALVRSRSASHPKWPTSWSYPGRIRYIQPQPRGATLITNSASIQITFLAPNLVRVRYQPAALPQHPSPSYAIAKPLEQWPLPELVRHSLKDACVFQSTDLLVGVHLGTAQLFFATPDGELLRSDLDVGWSHNGMLRHRVALAPEEKIFGLGERATPWNRRGRTHILWNTDPAGYRDGDDPINLNIPVYVGTVPGKNGTVTYLTLYENSFYAEFDLGTTTPSVAEHRFAGGELCYYLTTGTVQDVIERYTELTGRHSLQPLWMLGYQQSRWSYDSESRVRKLAQDFREHKVPCDVIHLDIDYMDGFRCFTWNRRRFPNPARMAADLRQQGFKLITIIDPGIKRDPSYHVYREGGSQGHFCTTPAGRVFHAPVWPGPSAFPDFTAPATRAWWGRQYQSLIDIGIAGFWNDMNEPATFAQWGERTLPGTIRHAMEDRGGCHYEAHNLYGMLMARATREGLEALRPDARPVVITRAGWAGVQRYATSWTADNESTWDALRLTIPMILGLGLSGVGFTGPDIGGFSGTPTGELFTRWMQMGVFIPFFRAHTAKGFPDQEPWSYGEPYLSIIRRFIELRYELLPYLYTALWQMCTRGWPMMRPLAWIAPSVAKLWDVDDAFLCGDSLLIAPILEPGATQRQVQLPPGYWYAFGDNHVIAGDREITASGPLETIPIFIREGTVLPRGEVGPHVEARPSHLLHLDIYAPRQVEAATSELYEDAGEGLAYQSGDFLHSRFTVRRTPDGFSVTWTRQGHYTSPYKHIDLRLNGLEHTPRQVWIDGERYTAIQFDPTHHTARLSVSPFGRLDVVI